MPIDPSIPLNVRAAQFENPLDVYGRVLQIKAFENQNKLADLMQTKQARELEDENRFRQIISDPSVFSGNKLPADIQSRLFSASPTKAQAFIKSQQELQTGKVTQYKGALEVGSKMLRSVSVNPTFENANAVLDTMEQIGLPVDQDRILLQKARTSPDQIRQWAITNSNEVDKLLPKFQQFDTGGAISVGVVNPMTGQYTQQQLIGKSQSPESIASNATAIRGQNLSDSRQRELNANQRELNAITKNANVDKRNKDLELKLADDYRNQSKDFNDMSIAHKKIIGLLPSATKSAASTLAAATSFMKMLDPPSVVRESELFMALKATGAIDRSLNYLNTLKYGDVLTKEQAKDFNKTINLIYEAGKQSQLAIDDVYRNKSQNYGIRPEVIIQELGQNKSLSGTKDKGGSVKYRPSLNKLIPLE